MKLKRTLLATALVAVSGYAAAFFLDNKEGGQRRRQAAERFRTMLARNTDAEDAALEEQIDSILGADGIDLERLHIFVSRGEVTLRGEVDSLEQISNIEHAVRQLDGVVDVENLLRLTGTAQTRS